MSNQLCVRVQGTKVPVPPRHTSSLLRLIQPCSGQQHNSRLHACRASAVDGATVCEYESPLSESLRLQASTHDAVKVRKNILQALLQNKGEDRPGLQAAPLPAPGDPLLRQYFLEA